MQFSATAVAFIGTGIAALTSLITALITARVAKANSFRQHLYVKRLETYEEIWAAVDRWSDEDVLALTEAEHKLMAKVALYGSFGVRMQFSHLASIVERALEGRNAIDGPDDQAERWIVFEGQRMVDIIGADSQKVAKGRFLGWLLSDRFDTIEVDEDRIGGSRDVKADLRAGPDDSGKHRLEGA